MDMEEPVLDEVDEEEVDESSDEDAEVAAAQETNKDEAQGDEELDDDDDDDDDDGFDFAEIAEKAVKAVEVGRRRLRNLPDLELDVGLSEEILYFSSGSGSSSMKAFDNNAESGQCKLDIADFATGYQMSAPAKTNTAKKRREVRGEAPRPLNDHKMRKQERKKEKEDKLEKWYGLRRRELTPELEKELKAIKLRGAADPKRFYKANDSKELPKYFAIATEVGGGLAAAGEHASREVTAHSGQSFLKSLLKDKNVQDFTKKKLREVTSRGRASKHSGHATFNKKKTSSAGAERRAWKKGMKRGRG